MWWLCSDIEDAILRAGAIFASIRLRRRPSLSHAASVLLPFTLACWFSTNLQTSSSTEIVVKRVVVATTEISSCHCNSALSGWTVVYLDGFSGSEHAQFEIIFSDDDDDDGGGDSTAVASLVCSLRPSGSID
jgi:hypothetical protein